LILSVSGVVALTTVASAALLREAGTLGRHAAHAGHGMALGATMALLSPT